MSFLPSKKNSWLTLITFLIFDAVSSYYAVKYMGGREANPIITRYVQNSPILFFPIILVLGGGIIYFICFILKNLTCFILSKFGYKNKEVIDRIIVTSIAIFYFLGIVVNNGLFLLGIRFPSMIKFNFTIGVIVSFIYAAVILYKESRKNVSG